MAKIVETGNNPFVKNQEDLNTHSSLGSYTDGLSELREDLIDVRNSLYKLDYEDLYDVEFIEPVRYLHEKSADHLQSEIEDIDDLLFDSKWPFANEEVTLKEYIQEAACSGIILGAIRRNHDNFNGDVCDEMDEVSELEISLKGIVLDLVANMDESGPTAPKV